MPKNRVRATGGASKQTSDKATGDKGCLTRRGLRGAWGVGMVERTTTNSGVRGGEDMRELASSNKASGVRRRKAGRRFFAIVGEATREAFIEMIGEAVMAGEREW